MRTHILSHGLNGSYRELIPEPPRYIVLYEHQSKHDGLARIGIATADYNGVGWDACSEPGQPKIVQWLDPDTGRFTSKLKRGVNK